MVVTGRVARYAAGAPAAAAAAQLVTWRKKAKTRIKATMTMAKSSM
jgi:hypothetical protein